MKRVKHDPLVYYALRDGLVKIGTTTLLAQRMSALDIDRILAVEPGSESLESERHAQFAELHVHHEWFRPGEDLIAHAEAMRAIHGLPDFRKRTARGMPILTPEHLATLALLPTPVIPLPRGTLERFAARIRLDDDGTCRFRFAVADSLTGYGSFNLKGKNNIGAHKASHLMFIGPVPKGYHVDHVRDRGCANRDCVWWEHLEAVPRIVNVQRGDSGLWQTEKTHCARGHEFTPDNIYWTGPDKKWRICKTCRLQDCQDRYDREHPDRRPNPGRIPNGQKTHCPRGHLYDEANTYIGPKGGRACRHCMRDDARHRYQLKNGLELT